LTDLVKVGEISEFDTDTLTPFDVEGIELMGYRSNGQYIVSSRVCTHKYFDLTKGHFAENYVTCTLHTSTFDLRDGDALNPPAYERLNTYVTVVKDDIVYIDLDQS